MAEFRLETPRLLLRSWRSGDLDDFHAVNSDPEVMATLGPVMGRAEVAALIVRQQEREAEHGHTMWAMELRGQSRVIGWCGAIVSAVGPITGKREIGWRLARDCWGRGLVTEGARAVVDWLFANRDDDALWAITSVGNDRSRAVMARLGMRRIPDCDFGHPSFPPDHPLHQHVTYRVDRPA